MTVVEYDGRIVVVDVGLRFPTPEMVGIDLVLPDFSYLRERAEDIEAIVVTHGHEDHLGALPWVLRDLGDRAAGRRSTAGPLTLAMARSKLEEHKLRDVELNELDAGEALELGPVHARDDPHDPLDPRLQRGGAGDRARDGAGHRRLQVRPDPVDGAPADVSRLAELGREGVLLLCGDSTNVDRDGLLALGVGRGARTWRRSSPAARGGSW